MTRAVVTVPAYFNDAQRNATKRAGELAGLTVERIVNEPTAAALAYGSTSLRAGRRSRFTIWAAGHSNFDPAIERWRFEVLATNGNTRLGGDDIDQAIMANCKLQACRFEAGAMGEIARGDRGGEASAFRREETSIDIPFFYGPKSLHVDLTREELEKVARPIVEQTRAHCLRALADAKLTPADLDEVILVGGVTRMPLVRKFVAELFGREPNISQNPDEAVAIGATIQAGILSGAVRDVVLLDVTPLSLGIETFGGLMNVIIPRNSTIPTKAGEMFTTAVSNQRPCRSRYCKASEKWRGTIGNWANSRSSLRPRRKECRVWACSSRSMRTEFSMSWRATQKPGGRKSWNQKRGRCSDEAVEKMLPNRSIMRSKT